MKAFIKELLVCQILFRDIWKTPLLSLRAKRSNL